MDEERWRLPFYFGILLLVLSLGFASVNHTLYDLMTRTDRSFWQDLLKLIVPFVISLIFIVVGIKRFFEDS